VRAQVKGKSGQVAAGVRPEKLSIGRDGGVNELAGKVVESAYIGVATQLVVDTRQAQSRSSPRTSTRAAVFPPPGRT
jgi:hypothetical protein